jgi:hypothetical protein
MNWPMAFAIVGGLLVSWMGLSACIRAWKGVDPDADQQQARATREDIR